MAEYEEIQDYIYDEVLRGIEDLLDFAKDRLENENDEIKNRIWNFISIDINKKIKEKKD